jgi:hypothetical protein
LSNKNKCVVPALDPEAHLVFFSVLLCAFSNSLIDFCFFIVIASEAKQSTFTESVWIATSAFGLLAMTD